MMYLGISFSLFQCIWMLIFSGQNLFAFSCKLPPGFRFAAFHKIYCGHEYIDHAMIYTSPLFASQFVVEFKRTHPDQLFWMVNSNQFEIFGDCLSYIWKRFHSGNAIPVGVLHLGY